jgi:putative two-component system response regulator
METKRDLVVMVDDDITNLTVGMSNLSESYDVFTAPSGKKLFALLEKVTPSLILLDIEMPEMNGYEVIQILKASEKTSNIPVIFLTATIDPRNEVKGLSLGAVDYITKPFSRELLIKRVNLHILFEKQKNELLKNNLLLEKEVDKKSLIVFELQNTILKTIAELVECRDSITGGHIERTQHYLGLLLDFLVEHKVYADELAAWDINLLIMSSQLHDVGKISIKDEILMKPGKLTDDEMEEMKKHTVYGVDIIRKIESKTTENEFLQYAETLAGSHHEMWNGKGYPYGLKGNDIPLQGRLMAIVDVYDALTNERSYKKAYTHEEAIEIIKAKSGKHFDPLIGEIFIAHEKEFNRSVTDGTLFNDVYQRLETSEELYPTIKVVANILDSRDGIKDSHTEDTQRYLQIFIGALLKNELFNDEVRGWDIELFLLSAQLHDVGKIAVPSNILNKEIKLTEAEFECVKSHADFGIKIVQGMKEKIHNGSLLFHAEAMAGSHHEKWDGSGYPSGLKGNAIPLQGRIMAIVDVYEALVSDRPHRTKKTHKEAVEIIRSGSGTQFDPELVKVFLDYNKEFESVRQL